MRISGVICECDPLHAGHRGLFDAARAHSDALVCAMSGYFTQRGEAAILSPHLRARLLLSAGVNAVFELPFPFCAATGERFGAVGVTVLAELGVSDLWFGSECGDIALLQTAAELTDRAEFRSAYRNATRAGQGTAAAYVDCLRQMLGADAPIFPNDLLAISYLRELNATGNRIVAHTIKRTGNGFRDGEVRSGQTPSATALRSLLFREGAEAWRPFFSAAELDLIRSEIECGRAPADLSRLDPVCLAWLRTADASALDAIPGFGGGIGRRLIEVSRKVADLPSLLRTCGVRCPTARLRRGLLFALSGVTDRDLRSSPAYLLLLAADRTGCRILADRRRGDGLPIVSKRAELPRETLAVRQALLSDRAVGLWALCLPEPIPPRDLLRSTAVIVK